MMKYYKHPETSEVFAYQNEAERQELGAPDLVEMTPAEIDAHLNPPVDPEELADAARSHRDTLLAATTWMVERHREEQETGSTTLTAQEYSALLAYRQALHDVPQQAGFPEAINWPVLPE